MSFFLVRLYPQLFVWRAHVFFPGSSLSPVICMEGSCLFSWFVFIPPYKQLGIKSNQEKRQEPSLQTTGDKVEPGKKT
jgi:hypothetical protein